MSAGTVSTSQEAVREDSLVREIPLDRIFLPAPSECISHPQGQEGRGCHGARVTRMD